MTSARARSLSPPPYIPSAPRQLLYNEEDAFQLRVSSLDDSTRESEAKKERERLVRLAMGIVEEVVEPVAEPSKIDVGEEKRLLPKVEGFANEEDDSDDDEIFKQQAAMRLRGGGGVSSDSDSDSESEEENEEGDVKMDGVDKPTTAKTTLVKESLKDMFKPQEEQAGECCPLDIESNVRIRS